MTEEEFQTAITVVRNKYQSRVSIAKTFMTPEQWLVFRSKPFIRERADKPRKWITTEKITRADISELELPVQHFKAGKKYQMLGKVDWTYFTRVSMDQIRRIISGDYEPKVRVVQPRKGYVWMDEKGIVI